MMTMVVEVDTENNLSLRAGANHYNHASIGIFHTLSKRYGIKVSTDKKYSHSSKTEKFYAYAKFQNSMKLEKSSQHSIRTILKTNFSKNRKNVITCKTYTRVCIIS